MAIYKNILVAIDLYSNCGEFLLQRTVSVLQVTTAALTVVYAVEPIYNYGISAYPSLIDLENEVLVEAKQQLAQLAAKFIITETQQMVIIGSPKSVILEQAKRQQCDLIVIGSHGRHGIGALFGSTASSVVHHAHCDVWVVRIPKDLA